MTLLRTRYSPVSSPACRQVVIAGVWKHKGGTVSHTFTHSSPFFPSADAGKFPGGLSALADYIHSKGLKFGLYSAASSVVCSGRVGSLYHEALDAGTFAKAGVDIIKCARRGVGGQWRQKRGCG